MNILVLTSTYSRWKDDTEPKFVDNLCQNMARGHRVHVVAPHAKGIPTSEVLDGIPVFRFRYCLESWQTLAYNGGILPNLKSNRLRLLLVPLFIASQLLLVIRLVRKYHYDVIHAHWIIPQGLVAILARPLARSRPSVVVTSHGGDLFALQGSLLARLKKWITRRADALTVVSNVMRHKAVAMGLKDERSIRSIPMGVESGGSFVPPAQNAVRKDLLFVGRLVDKKGVEYLLRALPEILAHHPDTKLTVIGDGPLRSALMRICSELGVAESVTFTGSLTNRDIPPYVQSCAIAIFPSVVTDSGDQEGTPVAIMEAMACACPVIVSDYPGARDIIQPDANGLLVEQKHPGQIAQAVNRLLGDTALRQALGEAGRRYVEQTYDWTIISAKFLELFKTLSASTTTSHPELPR